MPCRVRPFRSTDRAAVRGICADTGCRGDPIDPVFGDRDVFADCLTRYYTDFEPESALIAEDEETGLVIGYLLGCRHSWRHALVQTGLLLGAVVPKTLWRLATLRYNGATRHFLWWVITRSARETPPVPRHAAHFHINLLPAFRDGHATRQLIFPYVASVAARNGMRGVYGQMQVRDDRRTARVFERYGFRILERRRLTKFSHVDPEPIYLATIFKAFD